MAQEAAAPLSGSFADLCAVDGEHPSKLWRISSRLDPALWRSRIVCDLSSPSRPILRISVHPGDAPDQSIGDAPTERVEIQIKKEVIKFDEPTWYHFAFRLEAPWRGIGNRTVIHQVKQNIPTEETKPLGACQAANPLFKIEAIPSETGANFVAKVRGSADCNAGQSKIICGPWHLNVGDWNDVNVMLKPSLQEGASSIQVYLNGRACDSPIRGASAFSITVCGIKTAARSSTFSRALGSIGTLFPAWCNQLTSRISSSGRRTLPAIPLGRNWQYPLSNHPIFSDR
ncbi:polysaccharide lyase-like protein [Rhizobium sp. ERR 922]|uniref:heparin lyase I family protein n=1 Tax=unclassified Rhizobium TaxID=2613769 RepID=UPI0011AC8900|nr:MULTISPECIES: heparin lyase I family protein [unclassified Rhizobium]TWB58470.1 polysaccharide lyase-like protein [Rhizobium sp. ERR 922]TWC00166.1 polysaccharide lyase-like protein [Rhizobium sp. ERR 942]